MCLTRYINEALAVNAGIHFSGFNVEDRFYTLLQTRLSLRHRLTPTTSLKASYATMTQFMHLLTSAGGGLPNDLWVPSTRNIRPQRSEQVALGIAETFTGKSVYEFTAEAYYKRMSKLVEYKDWAISPPLSDQHILYSATARSKIKRRY